MFFSGLLMSWASSSMSSADDRRGHTHSRERETGSAQEMASLQPAPHEGQPCSPRRPKYIRDPSMFLLEESMLRSGPSPGGSSHSSSCSSSPHGAVAAGMPSMQRNLSSVSLDGGSNPPAGPT